MKKRTLSLLLSLCILLALTPAAALPAAASTNGHTQAEAVAWAKQQVGKYLDYDGAYGAQCVDLTKYYYAYLGNGKYGTGNATNYQSNTLPPGWTRVKSNPQPGDVIVWGGGTKGSAGWTVHEYGHIGIVVAVNGNKLTTVEQNINGSPCKTVSREASYATCFIRPDFSDTKFDSYPDPQPTSGKDYIIANKASGKLLDVYGGDNSSTSKSNVQIWEAVGTNKSQRFRLVKNDSGWWSIIPLSNTGLAVNPFSDTPGNGTNVNVYTKDASDMTQGWYFEPVDGGYYIIHSAYNRDTVLTASGKDNKSNVQLATNSKTDYQLWMLTVDGEEGENPQPHVHSYTAEVTKPTCTEDGFTTYTCEDCGDTYQDDTVLALGHDFKNGVCTRCGEADKTAGTGNTISLQIGNPMMTVNGEKKPIDAEGTTPQIVNDRTLLPIRAVMENMGGTVGWDGATSTVTLKKDGKTLYLRINTAYCWDDSGSNIPLDSPPIIVNNRTLLPIRAVAEYFGASVEWDGATRTATIRY